MRLSSVIVLAAFALLASASPIGHSRRSNSLWRRVTGGGPVISAVASGSSSQKYGSNKSSGQSPEPDYDGTPLDHTHPDGTFIQDDVDTVTGQRQSYVRFRERRGMIMFSPTNAVPWNPPTQGDAHGQASQRNDSTFNEVNFHGFYLRDFRGPVIMVSFLRYRNGNWMTFYPPSALHPIQPYGPNGQLTNYTTSENLRNDRTYVREFFGPDGQPVFLVQRSTNGTWTMSPRLPNIQWLSPPTQ